MGKTLPKKLRVKWDSLIETEGKKLGLENCRPFLENKMVNDIFYTGTFKSRPCIVKCSSKAPDSIRNEYEITHKLHTLAPSVFPEPFSYYISADRQYAFLVSEKLNPIPKGKFPCGAGEDLLTMASTLSDTGIVHRDIFIDNFMLGDNGHLKLIDFQFSIDRNNYCECRWMCKNWKYRYVIMGIHTGMPVGVWNDVTLMLEIARDFLSSEEFSKIHASLKAYENELEFAPRISAIDRLRLLLYKASLLVQKTFLPCGNKKEAVKRRISRLNYGVGK